MFLPGMVDLKLLRPSKYDLRVLLDDNYKHAAPPYICCY